MRIELNTRDFLNYLKVRESIESGDIFLLLSYINVMYEKYTALAKATKWKQPEYIEYLKKLDDLLEEIYFRELLKCDTIFRELLKCGTIEKQLTKLKLLRETKKIDRDLKKKIENFVRDLQER